MPSTAFVVCHQGIGFPSGPAATQRVRSYANVLRSLGYDVMVICSTFSETSREGAENLSARGSEDGIGFWYPGGSTVRARGFARRRLRSITSWCRLIAAVLLQRPALVLTYPMTPSASIMLLPATRVAGGLFLCDESELPEIDAGEGSGHAARLRVNLWGLRRSDGVIAISESLAARLAAEIRADRLLIMPVVLDSKDFLPQSANCAVRAGVVFYAGRLNDAKDGVGTLIDAFGLVHQSRSSARLVLVGEPNISVVAEYRARVQELGLVDAVEFKGVIGRRAMLEEMGSAAVLVTARPDTPQNRVNVPTKVLEYLAAGRPVVATAVGHAKDLVSHRSTGLLVPPCDVESLAAAVLWVFDNEQEAQRMADRGRDNALSAFDYHGYTPTFGDFLARLKSRD